MGESAAAFNPDWTSHPGETVADLLEEKGWSQQELADRTGFTRKHINELVTGKAAITPDAALKLEATIGGSGRFWLAREAQYREALARRGAEEALESEREWLKGFPIADMVRYAWIRRMPTVGAQVAECLRFFGVATVAAWREKYEKPLAVFRAAEKVQRSTQAIAAWLRQGEREAERISCARFDEPSFRNGLTSIRGLTLEADPEVFFPKLVERCAGCGVAVVIVPAPKGCPASGATAWMGSDKAILQLSLRYKTNDQLWFTFFHEAGHIVLHGKRLFIEGAGAIDEEHEAEANEFASDILVPPAAAQELPTLNKSTAAVVSFAKRIGIAPGIVVGRMQRLKLLPWTHLNGLKVPYTWKVDE